MPRFTLEIRDVRNSVRSVSTLTVASEAHLWPYVVTAARRLKDRNGMRIRVADPSGGIVILSGAAAALSVAAMDDPSA